MSDFIESIYFPRQSAIDPKTGVARLKSSTLFGYRHLFNRHVKPNLNGEMMRHMDLQAAQRLMDKIASSVSLSSRSLQHIRWFLKAVFDVAQLEKAYDENRVNPFEKVELPRTTKRSTPTRYATLDNVLDMLDVLDDTPATVVALAAFSGLRKSEIQGLKWGDIKDRHINVQRTAWRTTQYEDTKTEASRDSVPIVPQLAEYLEAHRSGHPDEAHLFVAPKDESKNRPLDLHNLANRVIRPALAKKNIPWCGWHGFRRGLATNLHTLGVEDKDVQAILRHADVAVTQRSYIRVEEAIKTRAMNRLSKVLKAKEHASQKARKR